MDIGIVKVGCKAQEWGSVGGICRRLADARHDKLVLLPSAPGDMTDELLLQAHYTGKAGRELPHFLVHEGEENSGESFVHELSRLGMRARQVRPEDDAFFLRGSPCSHPYDGRGMAFASGNPLINCRPDIGSSAEACGPFLRMLRENDALVLTPWAVRCNGDIGLIKGRGGSDGSLVAAAEALSMAGESIGSMTKVTDVDGIYDDVIGRIAIIYARHLIPMLEHQGRWPVQRYALEEMEGTHLGMGVSHFDMPFQIGTYIRGGKDRL